MINRQRIFPAVVALLVAMPVWWASEVQAQAKPGAQGYPAAAQAMQVEGKIQNADPSRRLVTLEDGTQLTIPPTTSVRWESLKAGAIVKASFEERGGQKVVTSMEIKGQ